MRIGEGRAGVEADRLPLIVQARDGSGPNYQDDVGVGEKRETREIHKK